MRLEEHHKITSDEANTMTSVIRTAARAKRNTSLSALRVQKAGRRRSLADATHQMHQPEDDLARKLSLLRLEAEEEEKLKEVKEPKKSFFNMLSRDDKHDKHDKHDDDQKKEPRRSFFSMLSKDEKTEEEHKKEGPRRSFFRMFSKDSYDEEKKEGGTRMSLSVFGLGNEVNKEEDEEASSKNDESQV